MQRVEPSLHARRPDRMAPDHLCRAHHTEPEQLSQSIACDERVAWRPLECRRLDPHAEYDDAERNRNCGQDPPQAAECSHVRDFAGRLPTFGRALQPLTQP